MSFARLKSFRDPCTPPGSRPSMRAHKAAGARMRQGGRSETTGLHRSMRRCHANGNAWYRDNALD